MREKALRIGKPTPLIGVMSDPDTFDASKPAMLLLNSGVLHHVGACRASVKLARAVAAAGFPEAAEETWSDAMIEGTVLSGSAASVKAGLHGLLNMGAAEVLVSVVSAGDDPGASIDRSMQALAEVSRDLG